GQLVQFSPGSHDPFPQTQAPQSPGQFAQVSGGCSHLPLPHIGPPLDPEEAAIPPEPTAGVPPVPVVAAPPCPSDALVATPPPPRGWPRVPASGSGTKSNWSVEHATNDKSAIPTPRMPAREVMRSGEKSNAIRPRVRAAILLIGYGRDYPLRG